MTELDSDLLKVEVSTANVNLSYAEILCYAHTERI